MLPSLHVLALAALLPHALKVVPHGTRASFAPRMCAPLGDDDALADDLHRALDAISSAPRLGSPDSVCQGINQAWVLIFNAGKTDEGVYTLQGRTPHSSSYVLAFEQTDDADRFAYLLQAEGFDLATPLCWDTDQLSRFCSAGAFEVSLVPPGTLITPPKKNEYDTHAFETLEGAAALEHAYEAQQEMQERGSDMDMAADQGLDKYPDERDYFERLFRK